MSRSTFFLGFIVVILAAGVAWLFFADVPSDGKGSMYRGRGGRTIAVKVQTVEAREFSDVVEAIGNAQARESVVLTPRVSDTVSKLYFDSGMVVKKGQKLLEQTSDEELAQKKEAKANITEAKKQFERIKGLVNQGNATAVALETAERRLAEVQFRLAAVNARLNDRVIYAPFDGVLGLRQVSEGSLISTNTPITTIDAIDEMNLDFSVPERFIGILKVGQQVIARVQAYKDRDFIGIVKSVDSRVDPVTRAVTVRAVIKNSDLVLRPGMLMTVRLIANTWTAPYVAEQAVLTSSGTHYVFVVDDKNIAKRRSVTLGIRRRGYVEVKEGVSLGEKIVTEGLLRLGRSASKVTLVGQKDPRGQKKTVKPTKDRTKGNKKRSHTNNGGV